MQMLCDVISEAYSEWHALTIVLRIVLLFLSYFIKYSLSSKYITLSYISLRAKERLEIKQTTQTKQTKCLVNAFFVHRLIQNVKYRLLLTLRETCGLPLIPTTVLTELVLLVCSHV